VSELIFELSRPGRASFQHYPRPVRAPEIPTELLRSDQPQLPEVSELDVVRHYTRLSQRNFSIDTQFYPLGSCTMKYNPRVCNSLAMLPQFLARHPLAPAKTGQGSLACLHELQEMLKDVTGMAGVSLAPMAGAQGEFAGVAMIRAWHRQRGDDARTGLFSSDNKGRAGDQAGKNLFDCRIEAEGRKLQDAIRVAQFVLPDDCPGMGSKRRVFDHDALWRSRGAGSIDDISRVAQEEPLESVRDTLVCSGLLATEIDRVTGAINAAGLTVASQRRGGDWAALLCRKR